MLCHNLRRLGGDEVSLADEEGGVERLEVLDQAAGEELLVQACLHAGGFVCRSAIPADTFCQCAMVEWGSR